MLIVSSTVGSSTNTGWKRRSSAASFSMCLRYSSSVVAPMACSSPRASIGLSMLQASMAPSAAPAPTSVCISSMKRMICPAESVISLSTALSRSSNSPRYLAPATSAPRSSATSRLSRRPVGTSPLTMRCASPSTMAVLPTPGSPISTGLFLVRRLRIWTTRRISSSRPITGSSLPLRASAVRSRPYFASASYCASGRVGGHALAAADAGQRLHDGVVVHAVPRQQIAHLARRRGHRHQHVLGGDILVFHVAGDVLRLAQHVGRFAALAHLGRGAAGARLACQRLLDAALQPRRVDADLAQHGWDHAALLAQKRQQEMLGVHRGMVELLGEVLRLLHGLAQFLCHLVGSHTPPSLPGCISPRSERLFSPSIIAA